VVGHGGLEPHSCALPCISLRCTDTCREEAQIPPPRGDVRTLLIELLNTVRLGNSNLVTSDNKNHPTTPMIHG
jgi:hypothetical protein